MKLAPLLAALALAGCASPESIAQLESYQRSCAAGDAVGCELAQEQAVANTNEANTNALLVLGAAVLVPLAIIGARTYEPTEIFIPLPR